MRRRHVSHAGKPKPLNRAARRAGMGKQYGNGGGEQGGKKRRPFTIVVPFLDTPLGRAFASRSLPSAASLGPD